MMSVLEGLKNVVMLQEDGATCGSFVSVKSLNNLHFFLHVLKRITLRSTFSHVSWDDGGLHASSLT